MVLDETAREEIGRQNVNNRVALAIEPRDRAPRRRPLNLWRAQPVGDRAPPTPAQPLARAQQVGDRVPPRRPFNLWRARNRLATESRRDARSTSGARATGWRPSPAATPVQPLARAQQVGDRVPPRRPFNLWRARNRLATESRRDAHSTSGARATGWRPSPAATPVQPLARAQQVGDRVPPRRPFNLWRARNRLATESRRDAHSTSGVRATGWRPSPAATPVQPLARAQQVGGRVPPRRPFIPVARAQPVGHRAPRRRPFIPVARAQPVGHRAPRRRPFIPVARAQPVGHRAPRRRLFNRWHARNRSVTEPLAAARSFRWHARNRSVTEPLAAARSSRWHARNRPVTEPLAAARSFRCGQSELPHQDHDGGLHRGRRLDPAPARP